MRKTKTPLTEDEIRDKCHTCRNCFQDYCIFWKRYIDDMVSQLYEETQYCAEFRHESKTHIINFL